MATDLTDATYSPADPLHYHAMREAVLRHYDGMYDSPWRQKLRSIAIALCRGHHAGDPFALTMGHGPHYTPTIAGNGAIAVVYPLQPAWATFLRDAEIALKAIEEQDG